MTQDEVWLTGWKEIANYMGLGVSTVYRAAKQGEFPVKKLGTSWGYVTVKKAELDGWKERGNKFGAERNQLE